MGGAQGGAEGHSNRIWPAFCPILTPDRTPTGARRTAPTGTGRDRYPFAAVTGRHPGGGLAWWLQIPMSLPPLPLSPPPPTSYLDGSLNARLVFWVELDLFAGPYPPSQTRAGGKRTSTTWAPRPERPPSHRAHANFLPRRYVQLAITVAWPAVLQGTPREAGNQGMCRSLPPWVRPNTAIER